MKLLIYLEKSKTFWSLLILTTIFFILRLPSLIEPYWYGDEGIYQVIGQTLNNGTLLYSGVWDNKPPLLYVTYALLQGDQFLVRVASLIVGLLTVIVFFFLTQLVYKNRAASVIATSIFVVLFATPYLEGNIANAENFILLPIIGGALLIYGLVTKHRLLTNRPQHLMLISIGLLLGVACMYKIVAVFDFIAFFLFFVIFTLPAKKVFSRQTINHSIHQGLPLVAGFITPLLIASLYFLTHNAFTDFFQSAFAGNVGYVGWKNDFIIPQGFLILKTIILVGSIVGLFLKRHSFSKPILFILLWLSLEVFSSFFSQRPYTHYVLMMLPSFCLLIGFIFTKQYPRKRILFILLALVIAYTVTQNFYFYGIKKSFAYYGNTIQFIMNKKSSTEYQSFFDRKTPRDYIIATYIKSHTKTSDSIFLWGDSAQIYALSNKLPITKYTVAYHMKQNKETLSETEKALKKAQPKYLITLTESGNIPFSLPEYSVKYTMEGATIYERTY